MELTFPDDERYFTYQIGHTTLPEARALGHLFFAPEDGAFVKRFERARLWTGQDLRQIQENFGNAVSDMIAHLEGSRPTPWEQALDAVMARLAGTGLSWWMAGSCALAVRGVSVVPRDIDLIFDQESLPTVASLFADCTVEPFHDSTGWVVRYFGVAFLQARIDLAFSPVDTVDHPQPVDFGPYARRHLESIPWRNTTVLVPPLDLQRAVNLRRGRKARVQAIDTFLAAGPG